MAKGVVKDLIAVVVAFTAIWVLLCLLRRTRKPELLILEVNLDTLFRDIAKDQAGPDDYGRF